MHTFISVFFVSALMAVLPNFVYAAAPDGSGPWADAVVSSNQTTIRNGAPVSEVNPARSNPQSAVGVAENDTTEGNFFSLGFGGSITLRFDNGIRGGVLVVESTNPEYPVERAQIEVSLDGETWFNAGAIDQDGEVQMPETLICARYVRITDISNRDDFAEDTADGFDVDGVQARDASSCEPTETPSVTPTPSPTDAPSNNSSNNNGGGSGQPAQCNAEKPPTPTLTSVTRTSGTTANLVWTAVSPVTHYAISYGLKPGEYQFGVPNTGNVTSFSIGGLDPNAAYYFSVRAINDCTPGEASGNGSTGSVLGAGTGGQVLGASTDTLAATGSSAALFRIIAAVATSVVTGAVLLRSGRYEHR